MIAVVQWNIPVLDRASSNEKYQPHLTLDLFILPFYQRGVCDLDIQINLVFKYGMSEKNQANGIDNQSPQSFVVIATPLLRPFEQVRTLNYLLRACTPYHPLRSALLLWAPSRGRLLCLPPHSSMCHRNSRKNVLFVHIICNS